MPDVTRLLIAAQAGDRQAAGQQSQHDAAPTAATSRVTDSAAAPSGTRTTTLESSTTSAIGSATIRTGANAGEGDGRGTPGSAARIRRQRSKFDRVIRRARQKALTVWPDLFQSSIVAFQARIFSGRCFDTTEFSLGENSQTT